MINKHETKGITLIALIITIIILLILAGISISALTNTGLFARAQEAKEKTNKAQIKEEVELAITELTMAYYQGEDVQENETLDQYISRKINGYTTTSGATLTYEDGNIVYTDKKGNVTNMTVDENWKITVEGTTTGGTTPVEPSEPEPPTPSDPIAKIQNTVLSTTDNTTLEDLYGNKITIPAGFKIKVDDTTNNATTVDKGIVIVDSNENEFVWIPVGKIYTDTAKTEANAKKIELNRYEFDSDGKPSTYSGSFVEEDSTDTANLKNYGNTIAKDINAFKTKASATVSGGFYIGRYEARTGTARSSEEDPLTAITEKGTDRVYNYVTQIQAAERCQTMYGSDKPFTSDLMNSYAWDTATLFLQTCGTNSTPYSRQSSVNNSLATTGTNDTTKYTGTQDVQCNVYDMASNVREWTTETYGYSFDPFIFRGGGYSSSGYYTSSRIHTNSSYSNVDNGFRPLLYV